MKNNQDYLSPAQQARCFPRRIQPQTGLGTNIFVKAFSLPYKINFSSLKKLGITILRLANQSNNTYPSVYLFITSSCLNINNTLTFPVQSTSTRRPYHEGYFEINISIYFNINSLFLYLYFTYFPYF